MLPTTGVVLAFAAAALQTPPLAEAVLVTNEVKAAPPQSVDFTSCQHMHVRSIANIRSISMWVKLAGFTAHSGRYQYLLDARSGNSRGWWANNQIGSNWKRLYVNGKQASNSPRSLSNGKWMHLYLESSIQFTDDVNFLSRFSNNECARGTMTGLCFWSTALGASEIADLARGVEPKSSRNLLAYFAFNEGSGSTVKATLGSASATTATLRGAPKWSQDMPPVPTRSGPTTTTTATTSTTTTTLGEPAFWTKGAAGDNCEGACLKLTGTSCVEFQWPTTVTHFQSILNQTGFKSCSSVDSGDWDVNPGQYEDYGNVCYWASKADLRCNHKKYGVARFCPCIGRLRSTTSPPTTTSTMQRTRRQPVTQQPSTTTQAVPTTTAPPQQDAPPPDSKRRRRRGKNARRRRRRRRKAPVDGDKRRRRRGKATGGAKRRRRRGKASKF